MSFWAPSIGVGKIKVGKSDSVPIVNTVILTVHYLLLTWCINVALLPVLTMGIAYTIHIRSIHSMMIVNNVFNGSCTNICMGN